MIRMARPAHPGQFVRMEVIEPLGLSVTEAARVLGVSRPALSALLNGRAALSSDMALRIEKAFGPKMDTLLRMQTAYEIAEARDRETSRLNATCRRSAPRRRRSLSEDGPSRDVVSSVPSCVRADL